MDQADAPDLRGGPNVGGPLTEPSWPSHPHPGRSGGPGPEDEMRDQDQSHPTIVVADAHRAAVLRNVEALGSP